MEIDEIKMDRPGLNALGTETIGWLMGRIKAAKGSCILLTGTGRAFCAGADLKEVSGMDRDGLRGYLLLLDQLYTLLHSHPGPTIACINGHAIAGGAVLAQACDHRICTDSPRTRIGITEAALGVAFPPATLEVLRQRLPKESIHRAILAAQLHSPQEALAMGIVDRLAENPLEEARKLARLLSTYDLDAYAATKRSIQGDGVQRALEDQAAREAILAAWDSTETRDRLAAALGG
jgi:enoyl-CoA hydratase